MKFTGLRILDETIAKYPTNLFYGEAGVGKTNLLLSIARNTCRELYPCVYINTEEVLYRDIVSRKPSEYSNVFFLNIWDYDEFREYIVNKLIYIPYRVLFIDSVNALYRLVAFRESSLIDYSLILGLIINKTISEESYLFASAQVRSVSNGDDEYVASGMSILEYWFGNIFKVGRDSKGRYVECVKPCTGIKVYFEITSDGIVWIN